ncbi:MAG: hypothetical protein AAFU80_04340 [Pseudomonadota bacterium]
MAEVVLFITVRAQPGQRDALRAVWERHLKARVVKTAAQPVYYYCYSREHPDEIRMFEHYTDESVLEENAMSAVFAAFMDEAGPLIAGQPEAAMADPVWIKPRDANQGTQST